MIDLNELLTGAMRLAHSPVQNYVLPGLTSYLIGEPSDKGRVRLFHATRDTRELVTPHSHRYDFTCLVLAGGVTNILYRQIASIFGGSEEGFEEYAKGVVRPIGTLGEYELTPGTEPSRYGRQANRYLTGDAYSMQHPQIHSIQFDAGTKVLFLEGPNLVPDSFVLEPWCYGQRVPTFKTEEWMFQT